MKETNKSLLKDLQDLIYNIPGSQERDHIAILLNKAVKFEISPPLIQAISNTIDKSTYTIEHNLDFLNIPFESTWIEWDEHERHKNGYLIEEDKHYPDKIGVLLAQNPSNENGVIGIVAWKTGNNIDHSQAVLSWNMETFKDFSYQARKFFSKDKNEVFARILSIVNTSVPQGFQEEMRILYDLNESNGKQIDDFYEDAHRNASSETLFILGFLLMLQTEQTNIMRKELLGDDFIYECNLIENSPRYLFSKPKGFQRRNLMRGAKLSWHPS